MKKSTKIILLLATLWPIFYMFFISGFMFFMMFNEILLAGSSDGPPAAFLFLFGFQFLTMFWVIALTIIYIVNVFKNARVPQDKKALWAVVIFLGYFIAQLVYWYLYIWREPPESQPSS